MTPELIVGTIVIGAFALHALGFIMLGRWCYLISRALLDKK